MINISVEAWSVEKRIDGEFIQRSVASPDDYVAIWQLAKSGDAEGKQFVVGSQSLEQGPVYRDFQHIAGGRSTIRVFVVIVDNGARENTLDVPEVHIQTFNLAQSNYLFVGFVHRNDLDPVSQHGDQFLVVVPEIF